MAEISLLGINGSPRRNGNTEFLLGHALDEVKKVASEWRKEIRIDSYSAAGKLFLPCSGCQRCRKLGYCSLEQKDDFGQLRDKWLQADAVLFAVPVYHMSIPGNIRNFLDRLGASVYKKYGSHVKFMKVYGCITQGAHLFSGQEHVITEMIHHALITGNIYVSGDMPQNYIGAAGWTENDSSDSHNALQKCYEEKHLDASFAVSAARSQARRVLQLALIIKAGALKHLQQLHEEKAFAPFVDRISL
jgi:multimeric flavodoxin WrbA